MNTSNIADEVIQEIQIEKDCSPKGKLDISKLPEEPSKFYKIVEQLYSTLCHTHTDPVERKLRFREILKEKKIKADDAKLLQKKYAVLEAEKFQQQETEKIPKITPEEKKEAMELLLCDNIYDRICSDIEKLGYVGENSLKFTNYAVASSAITHEQINNFNKGPSGSGKSECTKKVILLMPPERVLSVTRLTPQALSYYEDGIIDKWVIIQEQDGVDGAEHSLRVSISEGELKTLCPTKDPSTGKMRTEEITVPIKASFTITTTRNQVHAENETRFFSLYTNETPKQTLRIINSQKREARMELTLSPQEKEKITRTHRNAQRLLQPYHVRIPYAEHIDYPLRDVRGRRDFKRVLSLIKVVAHLRQFHKKPFKLHENQCIDADSKDYEIVYHLSKKLLQDTICAVPEATKKIVDLWLKKVKEDSCESTLSRKELQRLTGQSEAGVRRHIEILVSNEIISEDKTSGKYLHQLLISSMDELEEEVEGITSPEELENRIQKKTSPSSGDEAAKSQEMASEGHLRSSGRNCEQLRTCEQNAEHSQLRSHSQNGGGEQRVNPEAKNTTFAVSQSEEGGEVLKKKENSENTSTISEKISIPTKNTSISHKPTSLLKDKIRTTPVSGGMSYQEQREEFFGL